MQHGIRIIIYIPVKSTIGSVLISGGYFFIAATILLAGQHFSDVLGTKESKENPVIESEIRGSYHPDTIYSLPHSLSSDFYKSHGY